MKKNIIFHCPFSLDFNAKSASGIRPIKMLQAFNELGINVDLVVGSSYERKKAIRDIKNKIKNGYRYDFVYSESSTMPTALTDYHHLPLNPLLDFNFFKYLKLYNIKIALFYRDIYWMFEGYGVSLPWYKKKLALFFYNLDLRMYNNYVDKLYLPSLKMGDYIEISKKEIIDKLPPAHSTMNYYSIPIYDNRIELLYIGGMGLDYRMHELFCALHRLPNIKMTLCTREQDWLNVCSEYGAIPNNINIVHKSGDGLLELYDKANIALLFIEPKNYREFAVPFKLYEYIGRNKPIISTSGTLVGDFVEENNLGWTIDYSAEALIGLLNNLTNKMIEEKTKRVITFKKGETWESRAKQVISDLAIEV